jgi:transcriptional regulator of acetoin/glycerol metabolism
MTPPPDAAVPHDPFRHADRHRAATARQRFFEEGVRPTGLVSEAVIQSWSRCLQARLEPQRRPEFNPVTRSRIHAVLGRHQALLEAAHDQMARLQEALAGTASIAMLLDADGVVMHTTLGEAGAEQLVLPLAARVGVSLAEDNVGTTAPGITARMGVPCVVMGAEHFAAPVQRMYCAAAPIRDASGALVAVLDLSSEQRPFGFDASAVVGLYASAIENRLLVAQAGEQLVVRLQLDAALLDSPWAALIGVDGRGGIDWMNAAAARLLGEGAGAGARLSQPLLAQVGDTLGCTVEALLQIGRQGQPRRLRLANGLTVWLRVQLDRAAGGGSAAPAPAAREPDAAPGSGHAGPEVAGIACAAPTQADATMAHGSCDAAAGAAPLDVTGTLRGTSHALIDQALAACRGNVSAAARRLGVSRGLIYRHLQRQAAGTPPA